MAAAKAFVKRGVQFRTSPSAALSPRSAYHNNNYLPGEGSLPSAGQAALQQSRYGAGSYVPPSTPTWDSWMNDLHGDGFGYASGSRARNQTPIGFNGISGKPTTPAEPADYSDFLAQFNRQYSNGGFTNMSVDPADQAALEAEFAIRQKEMQLRQAELDGNMAEAIRLRGEIAANRIALETATTMRRRAAHLPFDNAMHTAARINERYTPAVARNTLEAGAGIGAAYGRASEQTQATADKLGSGEAALAAAMEIANADRGLYIDQETNRGRHALNMGPLLENVAKADVNRTIADFNLEALSSDALVGADWDAKQRANQESIEDLERGQAMLDLAKQRDALDQKNAERAMQEAAYDFDGGFTDALDYGASAASEYLFSLTGNIPLDRSYYLQSALGELTDMLPGMTQAQVAAWLAQPADPDDPSAGTNAQAKGLNPQEAQWIAQAWGVYQQATSDYTARSQRFGVPDGPKGQETVGGGGQAPANRQHAGDTSGPYYERSIKAEKMLDWLTDNFSVSSLGQWRSLDDVGRPDTAENSDHYSGGAIDVRGTESEMQRVLDWAANNPAVSFAKIHGNPRHVHISLKL